MKKALVISLVLGAALAGAGKSGACPIPVFEYALENWETDPYRVTLVHRGEIAGPAAAALELLEAAGAGREPGPANLEVATLDLESAENPAVHFPDRAVPAELPVILVGYPARPGRHAGGNFWSAPATPESARALLDSPARKQVAARLLAGETAAWVLLEGSSRQANREAADLLDRELRRLERTLRLPDTLETGAEPAGNGSEPGKQEISFTIIRVSRRDPAEQFFAAMLLDSEPDLRGFGPETPIAFPVFGRGLALYGLVGRGINPYTVNDAAGFLVGPCSCVIKSSNPGTDLLLAADWSRRRRPPTREIAPPAVGINEFFRRMGEADRITAETAPGTPPAEETAP